VARLLSWHGPVIVTFDAKHLFYPLLQACPSVEGASRPVADVLVAAWMLDPDAVSMGLVTSTTAPAAKAAAASKTGVITAHQIAQAYKATAQEAATTLSAAFALSSSASASPSPVAAPGSAIGQRTLGGYLATVSACWTRLRQHMQSAGMLFAFSRQEALIPAALAALEIRGMAFDASVLRSAQHKLEAHTKALERHAEALAGTAFNIRSAKECSGILYSTLNLKAVEKRVAYKARGPARKLHASTNEAVLEQMRDQHPLPGVILQHRKAFKCANTFVIPFLDVQTPASPGLDPLRTEQRRQSRAILAAPAAAAPASASSSSSLSLSLSLSCSAREGSRVSVTPAFEQFNTGSGASAALSHLTAPFRVHSALLQTSTATGRVSSRSPNIQNLPKLPIVLEAPPGMPVASSASAQSDTSVNVRDAMAVSSRNRELLSVDYGQIEMRLLAHFAADEGLLLATHGNATADTAASSASCDIYTAVAGQCFGVPPARVTKQQRQQAKVCCLGLMYGQGKDDAARKLGVTDAEAKAVQSSLLRKFPGISRFLAAAKRFAASHGWVPTATGRRRVLPGIRSGDSKAVREAERQAVNAVIQGSAADLIKTAMLILVGILAAARDVVFGPPLGREPLSKQSSIAQQTPPASAATQGVGFTGPLADLSPEAVWCLAHCTIVHQIHDELLLEVPSTISGAAGEAAGGSKPRVLIASILRHVLTVQAPAAVQSVSQQWLASVAGATSASGAAAGLVRLIGTSVSGLRCRFDVSFAAGHSYGSLVNVEL
jgi:DNA polymerase I-like protein with 3'-5' exonuclease and polymerase domains